MFVAAAAWGQAWGQAPQAPEPLPSAPDAAAQAANPQPLADGEWRRIQDLARGQWILVSTNFRQPVRCRFDGATEFYLFCTVSRNPDDSGFRFERLTVTSVELTRAPREQSDLHPGWISAIMAGGIVVGFAATAATDAGHATEAGLIGALCTAAVTAPMVFLPRDSSPWGMPMYGGSPRGVAVRVPIRHPRIWVRSRSMNRVR